MQPAKLCLINSSTSANISTCSLTSSKGNCQAVLNFTVRVLANIEPRSVVDVTSISHFLGTQLDVKEK